MFFITIILMGVVNLQSSNLGLLNSQNIEVQGHFLANEGLEILDVIVFEPANNGCTTVAAPDHDLCPSKIFCSLNPNPGAGGTWQMRDEQANPEVIDNTFERTFCLDDTGLTNAYLATSNVVWEDSTGEHVITAKRIISQ